MLNFLYNWPELIISKLPVPLNAAFEYMVHGSFCDLCFSPLWALEFQWLWTVSSSVRENQKKWLVFLWEIDKGDKIVREKLGLCNEIVKEKTGWG